MGTLHIQFLIVVTSFIVTSRKVLMLHLRKESCEMSVCFKDSPFYPDLLPCRWCKDTNGKLTCTISGDTCNNAKSCKNYDPLAAKDYRDNLHHSLRPQWIQKVENSSIVDVCSNCGSLLPKNQWNNSYYSKYCPSCGKRMYLEGEEVETIDPGIYQHFKGRQYKVLGVGQHTETNEKLVMYQALYGKYATYVRPLSMFVEDIEDITRHYRGPRFFKVSDSD